LAAREAMGRLKEPGAAAQVPARVPPSSPVAADRSRSRRRFGESPRDPHRPRSRTSRGCPHGRKGIRPSRSSRSRSTRRSRRRGRTSRGGSDIASRPPCPPRASGPRRRPPTDPPRLGVRPLRRRRRVSRQGGPGPARRDRPPRRGPTRCVRSGTCTRRPRWWSERQRGTGATGGRRNPGRGPRSSHPGARTLRCRTRTGPADGVGCLPSPLRYRGRPIRRHRLDLVPRFPHAPSARPCGRSIPGPHTTSRPTHTRRRPRRSDR